MSDLPKLSIGLVTFKRTEEALATVRSTIENLDYPIDLRSWYIGDDGSPDGHVDAILKELKKHGENVLGVNRDRLRPEGLHNTYFCGRVWNLALGICHQNSDFVLWLEDDWNLDEKLDLRPHIKLLAERDDVGIVSFRVLSVGCDVHTVAHAGTHYLKYFHTTQYAYSGNPYLRHARMTNHYGWFHEERNPGLIELEYDDRYRLDDTGPDIWRPVAISPWGGWKHIGTFKAYQ